MREGRSPPAKEEAMTSRRVVMVAMPCQEVFEIGGALDIFYAANGRLPPGRGYAVEVVSPVATVREWPGLRLASARSYRAVRGDIDTLIVSVIGEPAGSPRDPGLAPWPRARPGAGRGGRGTARGSTGRATDGVLPQAAGRSGAVQRAALDPDSGARAPARSAGVDPRPPRARPVGRHARAARRDEPAEFLSRLRARDRDDTRALRRAGPRRSGEAVARGDDARHPGRRRRVRVRQPRNDAHRVPSRARRQPPELPQPLPHDRGLDREDEL